MDTLLLTRRRSQLELLAQACESRYTARVALAARSHQTPPTQTRFLAVEPNGVLVEWPLPGVGDIAVSGARVTVFFEHQAQCFSFGTETRGRAWWASSGRGQVPAWKLGMPLRIDHHELRADYRVSLTGIGPVAARCTSVTDPHRCFSVRLQNISTGGLSATAALTKAGPLHAGALFWTQFELPGEPGPFEFVVRLAHVHTSRPTDTLVLGCAFCCGEDPLPHRAQLGRISQFVARRQKLSPPSADGTGTEESS